ncbi:hypothetical protein AAC387_Pa05g2030 [Persea americana]
MPLLSSPSAPSPSHIYLETLPIESSTGLKVEEALCSPHLLHHHHHPSAIIGMMSSATLVEARLASTRALPGGPTGMLSPSDITLVDGNHEAKEN